jgi:hypothetical protein
MPTSPPSSQIGGNIVVSIISAKLDATCSDEILSSNEMSSPMLGSKISTPPFVRPGTLDLAIKLAASLSEATSSGGFGGGLLLQSSHA